MKSSACGLKIVYCLIAWLLSVICVTAWASPADNSFYVYNQPDGVSFKARLQGDEWWHWTENAYGFAIAQDEDEFWYYIDTSASGQQQQSVDVEKGFTPSDTPLLLNVRADLPPPETVRKYDPPEVSDSSFAEEEDSEAITSLQAATPPQGRFTGNVLTILVEFSDVKGRYPPGSWGVEEYGLFAKIARYYNVASYRLVTLQPAAEKSRVVNDGVVGWLNVSSRLKALEIAQNVADQSGKHPNTGPEQGSKFPGKAVMLDLLLAKAAILSADSLVDFAVYDKNGDGYVTPNELAIQIVVAGYEAATTVPAGQKSVWAHQSSIPSGSVGLPKVDGKQISSYSMFGETHGSDGDHQSTLGIPVHELGHLIFGWPDLYRATQVSGPGIGPWCVMGNGNWGRTAGQKYIGETPVLPSVYLKAKRQWVTVRAAPNTDGIVSFTAAGDPSANGDNTVTKGGEGQREYFLIENRANIGYDKGLQGKLGLANWRGGLAIWHIDENMTSNRNDNHRLVSLEGANGWTTGYGSPNVLYKKGGYDSFIWESTGSGRPGSQKYNGQPSWLIVEEISNPGTTMSARMEKAGRIRVLIKPEEAATHGGLWRVCRDTYCSTWNGSGREELWFPGPQSKVEFSSLPGWTKPASVDANILSLQTIQVTGTYVQPALEGKAYYTFLGKGCSADYSDKVNFGFNFLAQAGKLVLQSGPANTTASGSITPDNVVLKFDYKWSSTSADYTERINGGFTGKKDNTIPPYGGNYKGSTTYTKTVWVDGAVTCNVTRTADSSYFNFTAGSQ
jgi:M6 family metalloprotease-like protein